ncbi:MAG: hypothetical protein HY644_00930 [Acidobacteria bacterium]|nr:hypothetical protein [Acidobacteriota bacterium]
MKNLVMVVLVLAIALVIGTNVAAQNLGEVVFQQTVSTAESKSLLYHFAAKVGVGFDTAMSLSNVRTVPTSPPTPGTFTIFAVNRTPNSGGTVTTGTSTQLTRTLPSGENAYSTIAVGTKRALVETASFFLGEFLADRGTTGTFIGYVIVNHAFNIGTGVANVIDFSTGTGFNITYVAAQYFSGAASTSPTNTKQ